VAAWPGRGHLGGRDFNFSALHAHYREFMGGFTDWVEQGRRQQGRPRLPPAGSATRSRPRCAEPVVRGNYKRPTAWRSALPGRTYRAVPGRPQGAREGDRPPLAREGRDGLRHEELRCRGGTPPSGSRHKRLKHVRQQPRPSSIKVFLEGRRTSSSRASRGLSATFTSPSPATNRGAIAYTGPEADRSGRARRPGGFCTSPPTRRRGSASEEGKGVVWALLRRTIRLKGPLSLLVAFGKCFPQ